jgi:hypothetical protein
MKSRICETSSPIRRSGPPQSGQLSPGSSVIVSRGVSSATLGLPRRRGGLRVASSVSGSLSAVASSSAGGSVLPSAAWAISSPSSAISSCSISRSIFSELWP